MQKMDLFPCFVTLTAAMALGAAAAQAEPKPANGNAGKNALRGPAYLEQVGAPDDWQTDDAFWIEEDSLIPPELLDPNRSDRVVIADPGNTASQTQSGIDQVEFVFQWGRDNTASQRQSGSLNRLETIQISPGAMTEGRANSGAGNGPEYDIFGYEVDPGGSEPHNRAPEPGDSAEGAPHSGGNVAQQSQAGSEDFARTVQVGSGNRSVQAQRGDGNMSVIVQLGHRNRAESHQEGDRNSSVISQSGSDNLALVRQ